jgi:hypothetical protein
VLNVPAAAWRRPTTSKVCHGRCLDLAFQANLNTVGYKEANEKKVEKDPEKLKELQQEGVRENEIREDLWKKIVRSFVAISPKIDRCTMRILSTVKSHKNSLNITKNAILYFA